MTAAAHGNARREPPVQQSVREEIGESAVSRLGGTRQKRWRRPKMTPRRRRTSVRRAPAIAAREPPRTVVDGQETSDGASHRSGNAMRAATGLGIGRRRSSKPTRRDAEELTTGGGGGSGAERGSGGVSSGRGDRRATAWSRRDERHGGALSPVGCARFRRNRDDAMEVRFISPIEL
ncbi:hypothetical protein Scep_019414 [Stephania cephalantha]|uniref:Uncharacterized protein n=1 Tax=Stephania cephalantha TaxID=152367 RepID=A0AAP0NN99_9MAGN